MSVSSAARVFLLAAVVVAPLAAQRPVAAGVPFTVHTPEPELLELALDEIELDWSEAGSAARPLAARPVAIDGTVLVEQAPTVAVYRVTNVTTPEQLAGVSRALEAANAGAEGNFVLYARNTNRDASMRRVLTTHLAFVLEDPADPHRVVEQLAGLNPATLPGIPGGFVIEALDPLSAIQFSDDIRARRGVKTAYPLVKRRQFVR